MDKYNLEKKKQLGMAFGTASGKLRKSLLFHLVVRLNENICFQCSSPINEEKDFSIEHKVPWLYTDSPKELFFNLDNIAFSHLKCNLKAARKPTKYPSEEQRYKARCSTKIKSGRKSYTSKKRHERYARLGK